MVVSAAVVSADSAALRARVPEEPAVPVLVRLVQAPQAVLAALLLRLGVRLPAQLAVLAQRPVAADPLLEGRRVLADLVLQAAVPVDLLLSRRSFSAAMARSTP